MKTFFLLNMQAKGDSLHGLGIVRSTKVDHTISRISIIVLMGACATKWGDRKINFRSWIDLAPSCVPVFMSLSLCISKTAHHF